MIRGIFYPISKSIDILADLDRGVAEATPSTDLVAPLLSPDHQDQSILINPTNGTLKLCSIGR